MVYLVIEQNPSEATEECTRSILLPHDDGQPMAFLWGGDGGHSAAVHVLRAGPLAGGDVDPAERVAARVFAQVESDRASVGEIQHVGPARGRGQVGLVRLAIGQQFVGRRDVPELDDGFDLACGPDRSDRRFGQSPLKLRTVSAELARWDDDSALNRGISQSSAPAELARWSA
jgi:hypothetical protein